MIKGITKNKTLRMEGIEFQRYKLYNVRKILAHGPNEALVGLLGTICLYLILNLYFRTIYYSFICKVILEVLQLKSAVESLIWHVGCLNEAHYQSFNNVSIKFERLFLEVNFFFCQDVIYCSIFKYSLYNTGCLLNFTVQVY